MLSMEYRTVKIMLFLMVIVFFWNQKIDTSFSVSVIPGFPYKIEFNSRLNGTTYYHFEETIQLAENEEKTIELDDKNAL